MEKNARLADIYIKIYNKRSLTFEDLAFLAKYDRECFEKTCQNVFYNMPAAKKLMEPEAGHKLKTNAKESAARPARPDAARSVAPEPAQDIGVLLDNLKKMEWDDVPVTGVDANHVKNLLGSLYMEMLFPHNDKYRYFQLESDEDESVFNEKA